MPGTARALLLGITWVPPIWWQSLPTRQYLVEQGVPDPRAWLRSNSQVGVETPPIDRHFVQSLRIFEPLLANRVPSRSLLQAITWSLAEKERTMAFRRTHRDAGCVNGHLTRASK